MVPLYLLNPPGGEAFLRENQGRDKVQDLEDDTFWEITQTFWHSLPQNQSLIMGWQYETQIPKIYFHKGRQQPMAWEEED